MAAAALTTFEVEGPTPDPLLSAMLYGLTCVSSGDLSRVTVEKRNPDRKGARKLPTMPLTTEPNSV